MLFFLKEVYWGITLPIFVPIKAFFEYLRASKAKDKFEKSLILFNSLQLTKKFHQKWSFNTPPKTVN